MTNQNTDLRGVIAPKLTCTASHIAVPHHPHLSTARHGPLQTDLETSIETSTHRRENADGGGLGSTNTMPDPRESIERSAKSHLSMHQAGKMINGLIRATHGIRTKTSEIITVQARSGILNFSIAMPHVQGHQIQMVPNKKPLYPCLFYLGAALQTLPTASPSFYRFVMCILGYRERD